MNLNRLEILFDSYNEKEDIINDNNETLLNLQTELCNLDAEKNKLNRQYAKLNKQRQAIEIELLKQHKNYYLDPAWSKNFDESTTLFNKILKISNQKSILNARINSLLKLNNELMELQVSDSEDSEKIKDSLTENL